MKQFFISAIMLSAGTVWAQDTLWVDLNGDTVEKARAEYYKVNRTNKDNTFTVTEFSKNGKKRSELTVTEKFGTTPNGPAKFYYDDGKLASIVNFEDGNMEGKFQTFLKDGTKSEGVFKNRLLYDGIILHQYDDCLITTEARNGEYLYKKITGISNPKLRQEIIYSGQTAVRSISHDKDGKLISDVPLINFQVIDGLDVQYSYDPFYVQSTTLYKSGKPIEETFFFKNGQVKCKSTGNEENRELVYYDLNGKIIARLTEAKDQYNILSPKDGTVSIYFIDDPESNSNSDRIESQTEYQNFKLVSIKKYRTDGSLEKVSYYDESEKLTKTENYDTKGNLSSQLTYEGDFSSPYEGTEITETGTRVYKNGYIISETEYYDNKKLFKKFEGKTATYYNSKGKIVGTMEYADRYNKGAYVDFYTGKVYSKMENVISAMAEYKNGELLKGVYYFTDRELVPSEETFYKKSEPIRILEYYKNGKLKSDITYSYSSEKTGIFYDNKGKKMAEYDFEKQNGTRYTFFKNTDVIQTITKYNNGVLQYEKITDYNTDTPTRYELIREIDYNKSGTFYENGKPLYTATYKNGKPYNGKVIATDESTYYKEIQNYANGVQDGEQITFDRTPDQIIRKALYKNGVLTETSDFFGNVVTTKTPYVNDLINGDVIYYDYNGKEISRVNYQNNEPVEGQAIMMVGGEITSQETYRNGQVVEHLTYTNTILTRKQTLIDEKDQLYQIDIYYTTGRQKMQYSEKEGTLHGNVRYFDPNGKKEYEAEIKNGNLIEGILWIQPIYSLNKNDSKYFKIQKSKNKLELWGIGHDDKVDFEMTVIASENKKSGITEIEMLAPYHLYPSVDFDINSAVDAAPLIAPPMPIKKED